MPGIAPACGGGEDIAPEPPAAGDRADDRGRRAPRRELKATTGTWINAPTSYRYRWQRLTARGWRDISGADEGRYTTEARDLGRRLRVVVAATNDDGTTATASAPTAPVGAIGLNKTATAKGRVKKKAKRKLEAPLT